MKRTKHTAERKGDRYITLHDLGSFTEEVILPGVERIVAEEFGELRSEMRAGFTEMRQGFRDMSTSIRVLAGEVAEIKVTMQEPKARRPYHEDRAETRHSA
jgi:hypothetical protein